MTLPPCPPCAKCGEKADVSYTIKSEIGSYCRCAACGHVWHVDAVQNKPSSHIDQRPKRKGT